LCAWHGLSSIGGVRALLASLLLLAATAPAGADSEDLWPVLHDVLGSQRELPCKEVWTFSDAASYVMTFDQAGRLVERANSSGGEHKRYGYDSRRRIVTIDGHDDLTGEFATKLRYGKRGIESLMQENTPPSGRQRKRSKFALIWRYPRANTVKISVAIDGKEKATDVHHYAKGRLSSIELSDGEVMTASYDAQGRLATMTNSYDGKTTSVRTFSYDEKGRLARETLDARAEGVKDQTHEYSYACSAK